MIIEELRKQIKTCGKSLCEISRKTGIDKAILCRMMQGRDCKTETASVLFKYFGLTIAKKGKKGK